MYVSGVVTESMPQNFYLKDRKRNSLEEELLMENQNLKQRIRDLEKIIEHDEDEYSLAASNVGGEKGILLFLITINKIFY